MSRLLDDDFYHTQDQNGRIKKFMFDCVFETDKQKELESRFQYTAEELQQEKIQSYLEGEEEGYKRGQEEMLQSIYQQCAQVLIHDLSRLLDQQEINEKKIHQSVAMLTSYVARTLLPTYIEQGALAEILNVIQRAFESVETTEVTLFIHPDMIEAIHQKIESLKNQYPHLDLKIQGSSSCNFNISDCRIEWQGGGVERRSKRIEEEIEIALSRLASYRAHLPTSELEKNRNDISIDDKIPSVSDDIPQSSLEDEDLVQKEDG